MLIRLTDAEGGTVWIQHLAITHMSATSTGGTIIRTTDGSNILVQEKVDTVINQVNQQP